MKNKTLNVLSIDFNHKMTSDTTTKTHNKYHLCQTCYNKVITAIDLKSI